MKAGTLIGIAIAIVGLLGGATMEGTKMSALFNVRRWSSSSVA
jgi:flagellar motor component MotA